MSTTPSIGQRYATTYGIDNPTKGSNGALGADPQTRQRLSELFRQMKISPAKPATIINMLPFTLYVNGVFHRDIQVPACPPGTPYVKYVIRRWKYTRDPQEDGTFTHRPIFPIELAADFLREYAHMGGIVVYDGEAAPEKLKEVSAFTADGTPIMQTVEYDGNQIEEPVMLDYQQVFDGARKVRDSYFRARVEEARAKWTDPTGKLKVEVGDDDRRMAEIMVADGILAELPDFCTQTREEAGLSATVCPNCKARPNEGALTCTNCNLYVFDPVTAYEHAVIEYGHPAMDRLDEEQWKKVNAIKAKRDKARGVKKTQDAKSE